MPDQLFYWVLNMSVTASAAGVLVLLLRRIKRLPRFVPYVLWAVPFIRFWLPFGIASRYSLMNLFAELTGHAAAVGDEGYISAMNSILAAESYDPFVYKSQLLQQVFFAAGLVWLIVFAAAVIASFMLYLAAKSEVKDAVPYRENVYLSDKVTAPAVYGIVHPKIILPASLAQKDMEYILLHERVHIRRRDNLLRAAAVATVCMHWFNPLAWVFLRCFFADMELSCDETVLKTCGPDKKKEYALALLGVQENKTVFVSAFGGAKTRVRVQSILSYRKMTAVSLFCCIALIAVIAAVLLTNAPAV